MLEAKGRQQLGRERLAFSALDMFSDFFTQTSGEPMSDAQARAMGELITTLSREQGAKHDAINADHAGLWPLCR